jgi:zinc transport system substrate-binding protein
MKLATLLLLGVLVPTVAGAAEEAALHVFVSVPPQKHFVERIGGEHVRVRTLVQPGQSPHSFEPTPSQVVAMAHADLYVRVGMPFEPVWLKRIQAANPDMPVLDAREGIEIVPLTDHDHEGETHPDETHEEGLDPHVWTSPPLVKTMAQRIRDGLAALDPAHADDYAARYAAFAAELDALDAEIRERLRDLTARRFMVYHPAWGYFAQTYGLTQVPIEKEGKEPGAKALASLIAQARREGIRVIFVQPQFSRRAAEEVARAIDGRVMAIDPLAEDYLENMRTVTRLLSQELRS